MAYNWEIGKQYTPSSLVRTGGAPGVLYQNPNWGISAANPGTLKEIRTINGVQYGDFGFKQGSGWVNLNQLESAMQPKPQPVAVTPKPVAVTQPQKTNNSYVEAAVAANPATTYVDYLQEQGLPSGAGFEQSKYYDPTTAEALAKADVTPQFNRLIKELNQDYAQSGENLQSSQAQSGTLGQRVGSTQTRNLSRSMGRDVFTTEQNKNVQIADLKENYLGRQYSKYQNDWFDHFASQFGVDKLLQLGISTTNPYSS